MLSIPFALCGIQLYLEFLHSAHAMSISKILLLFMSTFKV